MDKIFLSFDRDPIVDASHGQVDHAKLRGQEIVVKVYRPTVKELFDIDIKNLRVIEEYNKKVNQNSYGTKRDWIAIFDECATVLYQEIDYSKGLRVEFLATRFFGMTLTIYIQCFKEASSSSS